MAQHPYLISATQKLPRPGQPFGWGKLIGASAALATAELATVQDSPVVVLAEDPRQADQLEAAIRFFAGGDLEVHHFV